MPSQITHLAVAKRYLEKHPGVIRDVQAFLDGNVLPDLHPKKEVSHCGVRAEMHNVAKRNAEKVNPEKFLATHDLSIDLNRGQYLHLYVDYYYYNVFLLAYFKRVTMEQSSTDMYETTQRDDKYLQDKYGVRYDDTTLGSEVIALNQQWDDEVRERRKTWVYEIPYELDRLDDFIEEMSNTVIPLS